MSKLMWILGILLVAAGLALALMLFAAPASIVAWGITLEVASILVVGGVLAIGMGGVVNAVEHLPAPRVEMPAYAPPAGAPAPAIPEFGRRASETAAAPAAAAAAVAAADEEVSAPVKETIAALEQARQKIEQAFDATPPAEKTVAVAVATALPDPQPEPEPEAEPAVEEEPQPEAGETVEEGQLYVVEERFIRQRPARILSDGTVEAETDEGWMRFENLEHLDEYLDAMAQSAR